PLEGRAVPATFTVNTLNDTGPGSLRQAILDANATDDADTIDFQPGLGGTIRLDNGALQITRSLTISGPGAGALTLAGNGFARVLEIDNGAAGPIRVSLSGLTLTRGNAGSGGGGAIMVADEDLTLRGVVITGNTARDGGGVFVDPTGRLTLEGSTVSANRAVGVNSSGGGGAGAGRTGPAARH